MLVKKVVGCYIVSGKKQADYPFLFRLTADFLSFFFETS